MILNFNGGKRWKLKVMVGITAVSLLLVGFLLVRNLAVFGQEANAMATPLASGGGEYDPGQLDHMTDTQRQEIQDMLAENRAILAKNGRLPEPNFPAQVAFDWPLKLKDGLTDSGYHNVSGFVDHNLAYPNQLLDYNCQDRTYDTSGGYNHKGTDYFLWPFSWNKMDSGEVEIVAAAPGIIIGKQDGNYDRSCSFNSNDWNAVYVLHADDSVAWYGHMKQGSVTTKTIGQTVAAGEYLGLVGSSGNSTGPHLHFEVYDALNLIDPYAGACNNIDSWWAEQRPYYDSAVNKLTTGFAAVNFSTCPNPDTPNEQTSFYPGNDVYFTAYYRDQRNSQDSINTIYRPDGSVFDTWVLNSNSNDGNYSYSWWWRSYNIPVDALEGTWVYEVVFEGETYRHEFEIRMAYNFLPVVIKDPTPTPTATPTSTPTATPTSTPTVTPTPTSTPEVTALPTSES